MQWTDAEAAKGVVVLGRAVALMAIKAVVGVVPFERDHQPVARHFGDDRCGGDRQALRIALDDGAGFAVETRRTVAVDDHEFGFQVRPRVASAMAQREALRILSLSMRPTSATPMPMRAALEDAAEDDLAAVLVERLAVVDAVGDVVRVEDHRGGHDGSGQRAASGFVDAGDRVPPKGQLGGFQLEGRLDPRIIDFHGKIVGRTLDGVKAAGGDVHSGVGRGFECRSGVC